MILDDFLYNEDELILSTLIRENKFADAAKYIVKHQAIQHLPDVFHDQPLNIGASPLSLQINSNPRQRLIINPDRCGCTTPTYDGAKHIFSQSKREWKAAIHHAAERGMTDVVRLLITKADRSSLPDYVNIKDAYGMTPLHYAAMGGHEETMQYLVRSGADTLEREVGRSQCPWELMNRTKAYSKATRELMASITTTQATSVNLTTHPLYQAISLNNEEAVKNLSLNEEFFAYRAEFVAKARSLGNENLANYLSFVADLHILRKNYQVSLMPNDASEGEKNKAYLEFLKNSLDLLVQYNPNEVAQQFNMPAIMVMMRIASAIVNNISYTFREKSYNLVPWQNLESLNYTTQNIENDDNLKLLFRRELTNICTAFSTLRGNLERINPDGTIAGAAVANVAKIPGLQSIYLITDLIADLRSLERISSFVDIITEIDTTAPMSKGRLALLAITKQLGEFSKHSQQSSNLSSVAKRHFNEIPWKILEELRDHIAKAPSKPKAHSVYDSLLQDGDDTMLLGMRADIADIAVQARKAHSAMMEQVRSNGWDEIVASYYGDSNISDLSAEQQQELLDDLNAELAGTTKKNQKTKKGGVIQDVVAYLNPATPNAEIKNYAQLQSQIFGNFFKTADDPKKVKWTNIFQGRSGVYKGMEDCYDKFETSAAVAIDYPAKANTSLDKMMELVIGDSTIVDELKVNHDLSAQSYPVQKHLHDRLEAYDKSPELRLAIGQLYSELWLVTNHMGNDIQMDDNNTKMRNFVEHRNSIYDAADRNIDRANFLEFIGAIFNTHDKLITAGLRPGAIPIPVVGIAVGGATYSARNAII